MQLGPIQEKWLQFLEQNPELQGRYTLGEIIKDPQGNLTNETRLCCLGAAKYILSPEIEGTVYDGKHKNRLTNSVSVLGLRTSDGGLRKSFTLHGKDFSCLARMNDGINGIGFTWPEIAAYIRANPENVFTEAK